PAAFCRNDRQLRRCQKEEPTRVDACRKQRKKAKLSSSCPGTYQHEDGRDGRHDQQEQESPRKLYRPEVEGHKPTRLQQEGKAREQLYPSLQPKPKRPSKEQQEWVDDPPDPERERRRQKCTR